MEINTAKVEFIFKISMPKMIKDIYPLLGHAGFYRRFIKDYIILLSFFSHLIVQDVQFE